MSPNEPGPRELMAAVSIHHHDGYVVCSPSGELDAATAPEFRAAVAKVSCEQQVVIDMTDVTFIDSAGLGALIGAVRRVHENGGTIGVAVDRPSLLRLLEVVGFDKLVPIQENIEAAIAATADSQ